MNLKWPCLCMCVMQHIPRTWWKKWPATKRMHLSLTHVQLYRNVGMDGGFPEGCDETARITFTDTRNELKESVHFTDWSATTFKTGKHWLLAQVGGWGATKQDKTASPSVGSQPKSTHNNLHLMMALNKRSWKPQMPSLITRSSKGNDLKCMRLASTWRGFPSNSALRVTQAKLGRKVRRVWALLPVP